MPGLKISHGARELLQREIRANARVNGMDADDFFGVLDCTRDAAWMRAHYEGVLRAHPRG